ncbi:Zinc finger and SCAN domain-containing protein 29 [Platysternon megacephalum]|uniref:Zinc finger and SCAN domain-containing protein 29 n=1 Tax=Platysternon megacephalum TaxID=55544 RepID=A0A4D9EMP1_9SAUR|nr:Zinc finger and SCAN domain-containing protein 29 [Platysternon megacephalum]
MGFGHCNGVACPFRSQRPGAGQSQLVSLWTTHMRKKKKWSSTKPIYKRAAGSHEARETLNKQKDGTSKLSRQGKALSKQEKECRALQAGEKPKALQQKNLLLESGNFCVGTLMFCLDSQGRAFNSFQLFLSDYFIKWRYADIN